MGRNAVWFARMVQKLKRGSEREFQGWNVVWFGRESVAEPDDRGWRCAGRGGTVSVRYEFPAISAGANAGE